MYKSLRNILYNTVVYNTYSMNTFLSVPVAQILLSISGSSVPRLFYLVVVNLILSNLSSPVDGVVCCFNLTAAERDNNVGFTEICLVILWSSNKPLKSVDKFYCSCQ